MMKVWILTFNRPQVLNRQIETFGKLGYDVHIFSNHPQVGLTEENKQYIKEIVFNNLSDEEANSYCARSWNNIFIKAFKDGTEECVFVQDDTWCRPEIGQLIEENKDKYDLIWGPAGDTFFYMKKKVLAEIGWFDERYLACYCGDADFLKRAWLYYDRERLSIAETHDWGFFHNDIGIRQHISWDLKSKCLDENYVNQHQENEAKIGDSNYMLHHSQGHFKAKWGTPGNGINGIGPISSYEEPPLIAEIDWYPWFTKKYLRGEA